MSPRGQAQNQQMRAEAMEKIVNTSFEVFGEYGYHGTTMRQIARATGLSNGLVYHYFPSKEVLFRKLIDQALDRSKEVLEIALNGPGSPWEKIERLSALIIQDALLTESSRYFIIMLQATTQGKGIPGLAEHISTRSAIHYQMLLPVIIQAQEAGDVLPGDPVVLTAAYFAFVQGLALLAFQEGGMEKQLDPEILNRILKGSQK